MRKELTRLKAAVAAFSLAFSVSSGTANAVPDDVFAYDITGDVDTLDPHWGYDVVSQMVAWQNYETLIFYQGPSLKEFEPLLATVVPSRANSFISADGRRYTFPIRSGVLFHDGTKMTPEDVKYSFMRFLLLDRAGGPSGLLLEPMLGLETTRDAGGTLKPGVFEAADAAIQVQGGGVVFTLVEPFAPFLEILATFSPIVSKPWMAAHDGWDGTAATLPKLNNMPKESSPLHASVNGTGPFTLERWEKDQKRLVLARHEKYWRRPARLKRLVIKTVDDANTRRLRLGAGDADATILERQFLPQVESLPGVTVEDGLPLLEINNAFVFNRKINPVANPDIGSGALDGEGIPSDFFTDFDLRRAFAHSFDYEGYIKAGYRGKARKALGPIPYGVSGYDDGAHVPAFNPARATEQFQLAWGGKVWQKGFKFAVSFEQGRADRQLACQILKRNVETLNPKFRLECRPVLYSTWLDHLVRGKFPMVVARWALDFPDAQNCVRPFMHSHGFFAKASGYSSPRADRLIHEAARELDPDRRNALYRELQALAAIDLPAFFTVDTYAVRVRRSNVRDWWYNPILNYGYFYPVYKE